MAQQRALLPLLPVGAETASMSQVQALCAALSRGAVTVLSGAGMSTESGLRDYRSPGRVMTRTPMSVSEFAGSAAARRRYWARSYAGHELLSTAAPNRAHQALAHLHTENAPHFPAHVTQNVDGLLQRAGARPRTLVELHGTVLVVRCGVCGASEGRGRFQERLAHANGAFADAVPRPDGDAEVPEDVVRRFKVPICTQCGADSLEPAVVFHGGTVPKEVTAAARRAIDGADVVWVIGSTLTTYSAYSLVRRAKVNGVPVVAVNFGPTRADDLFDFKCETSVGDTVERVAQEILGM